MKQILTGSTNLTLLDSPEDVLLFDEVPQLKIKPETKKINNIFFILIKNYSVSYLK